MFKAVLSNFSKGELAPLLQGRVETQQYSAGLKIARNWVVQKYGGVSFRPGTRLVGKVDDPSKPIRLAPFQFSIDQAYCLVLGNATMRPAALGGFVLEQNTKITGATQANPCVLTVPYHGYAVGDRFYITGVAGMTQLNGRFVKATAIPDADHVTVDVDASAFSAFISSDGTLNVAPPPVPPAPPVPPDPYVPPPPPDVGGGGGRGFNGDGNIP